MDVIAGSAATVRVDFTTSLGALVPDANSVSYQLYGTDGTPIGTSTSVTTSGDTGVTLTIPGSANAITTPRLFEKRTIVLYLTSGGTPYSFKSSYRLVPFLNYSCTAADVRAVIGADEDELTDEEVDLVSAYFLVQAQLTDPTQLATALASGTRTELLANEAIVGMAVCEMNSGLPPQMAQTRKDGTMSFTRFEINWKAVNIQARAMVARGLAAISGVPSVDPTWVSPSYGPDPFTRWVGKLSFP